MSSEYRGVFKKTIDTPQVPSLNLIAEPSYGDFNPDAIYYVTSNKGNWRKNIRAR